MEEKSLKNYDMKLQQKLHAFASLHVDILEIHSLTKILFVGTLRIH